MATRMSPRNKAFFSPTYIELFALPPKGTRPALFDISPLRRWTPADLLKKPELTPVILIDCRFLPFKSQGSGDKCPGGCVVGSRATIPGTFAGFLQNGEVDLRMCDNYTLAPSDVGPPSRTWKTMAWHFVDLHEFLDYYASNGSLALPVEVVMGAKAVWPLPSNGEQREYGTE
jgi:hypothetical protein